MIWISLLMVGIGGMIGAVFRYGYCKYMSQKMSLTIYGTCSINILACLALGIISEIIFPNPYIQTLCVVGFIGSVSTFSLFISEIHELFKGKRVILSISYAFISIIGGLVAFQGGRLLILKL